MRRVRASDSRAILLTMSRTLSPLAYRALGRVLVAVAPVWRWWLGRTAHVTFIGVTGSAGKTTTTRLLPAMLEGAGPVAQTDRLVGQLNEVQLVARLVLSTRARHRFAVFEMGTGGPGIIRRFIKVLRPQSGVVTNINGDHFTAFRSLEETAKEKGQVVESLPPTGVAVLNADDARVLAMASRTRARVLTYGIASPTAEVRGEAVSGAWPDRVSMTVVMGDARVHVRTRLVGEHFATHVLAALATATAAGVPLADAAKAIEQQEPADGRCSVHEVDGITFIRDDWKAPLWSLAAAIRFMETARAPRRIMVIGTISDYPGARSRKYRAVARQAVAAVDHVFFVGPAAAGTNFDLPPEQLTVFETLAELQAHVEHYLQPGDLVMLKGSATADHLQRLVLARDGGVTCWRRACGRTMFCERCELRHVAASD